MKHAVLSTDPDYKVWTEIVRTREIIIKARQQDLDKYDIPVVQGAILFLVQFLGYRATPAEISRMLLRETHSISEIINRMQKRGLVRKVHDLERKNMVRIELTEKATSICTQAMRHMHNIMSVLSKDDRQKLLSSLQILQNKGLEELGVKDKKLYLTIPPLIP